MIEAEPASGSGAGAAGAAEPVTIAAATPADLGAVVRIAHASFDTPWSERGYAEELSRDDALALVARRGGGTVGYLLARLQAGELHVLSLAVAPASRTGGAGGALVARALRDASAAGAAVAHLEVRASAAPALACYRAAGFAVVGRRDGYYPGGEDALLLSLALPVGATAAARR